MQFLCESPPLPGAPQPPVAPKVPHITEIHDRKLVDNYFWLREHENPAVLQYLEAENRYTESVMEPTRSLQEDLYQEFLSRIQESDERPPYPWGEYLYSTRTEKGKQYKIYLRAPRSNPSASTTILDLNEEAVGHSFVDLDAFEVSDDGQWLAYTLDTRGYRQYTLHFKRLGVHKDGLVASETIERVTSLIWCPDNRTIFYTTEDAVSKRSDKFWRHTLGTNESELVFEEKNDLFDLGCDRSREGNMLFLHSMAKTSSEVRFARADRCSDWRVFARRQRGHEYDVDHREGVFYIRTNKDATNFKVMTAPEEMPEQWSELVAHDPSVMIEDIDLFSSFLVLSQRKNGSQQLEVIPLEPQDAPYLVPLPEPIHSVELDINHEYDTHKIRYEYESPVTPRTIYELDTRTGSVELLKQDPVLGGYRREDYTCQRIDVLARDGTAVPVSLVYRADLDRARPQPMLLYGYGSYGVSIDPTFSSNRLSLLQRGVIFAIAHIRGGGELGEPWRQAGRMASKMSTFHDFIDCAETLCNQGYTAADKLIINGASAGGLLMGVAINLRPDLFRAVVAKVPFVDVINTMLDASLPLTTAEYIEWGNPHQKTAFKRIMHYSPYDNIKAQSYPPMLVEVSLHDSQVPYWEGAKLVAKLREMKTDTHQILLKTNLNAGHGGSSGRYDALRETSFDYAYLLWQFGLWRPPEASGLK